MKISNNERDSLPTVRHYEAAFGATEDGYNLVKSSTTEPRVVKQTPEIRGWFSVIVILYLGVGILFYGAFAQWSILETIYFISLSISKSKQIKMVCFPRVLSKLENFLLHHIQSILQTSNGRLWRCLSNIRFAETLHDFLHSDRAIIGL